MTTERYTSFWRQKMNAKGSGIYITTLQQHMPSFQLWIRSTLYYCPITSMGNSSGINCSINLNFRESFFFTWINQKYFLFFSTTFVFNVKTHCRLPWDTQTPLGYFNEILFSIGVCVVYLVMTGTIILTFVSLCLYHRAFYRIFPHSLRKIDNSGNGHEQKELLIELIRFHNSAKRYKKQLIWRFHAIRLCHIS